MLISAFDFAKISSIADLNLAAQDDFLNHEGILAIPSITADSTIPVVKTTEYYASNSVDCFVEEGMLALFCGFDLKHDSVYLVLDFSKFKEHNRKLLTNSFFGKDDELITAEDAGLFYDTDFFYFCEPSEFDALIENPKLLSKKLLKALTPQTTRVFYSEHTTKSVPSVLSDNKSQLIEFLESYVSASSGNEFADKSKRLILHPLSTDFDKFRLLESNLEVEALINLGLVSIDHLDIEYGVSSTHAEDYDSDNVITVIVNLNYIRNHEVLTPFKEGSKFELGSRSVTKNVFFFGFGVENLDCVKDFSAQEIYEKISSEINKVLTLNF